MFYNKVEITICNLKSLNIEPSAYGSLLVPVLTSKLPTDLRTLFIQKFSDRVWELDEPLTLFRNELEAKERSLDLAIILKKNKITSVNFQHQVCFREAVVLNSLVYFVKVIIIHQIDVLK